MVKASDLVQGHDGSKLVPRNWKLNCQISEIIQMSNKLDKNIEKNKDLEKKKKYIYIYKIYKR